MVHKLKSISLEPLVYFLRGLYYSKFLDTINILNKRIWAYMYLRRTIECYFWCLILIQIVIRLDVCIIIQSYQWLSQGVCFTFIFWISTRQWFTCNMAQVTFDLPYIICSSIMCKRQKIKDICKRVRIFRYNIFDLF